MLQRDYLMKLLADFAQAIVRTMDREQKKLDPTEAALSLEAAIGAAVDIDGETLLSLAPESMATVLQVSGTDPRIIEYIARSLLLGSEYSFQAGNDQLADLRKGQAMALAQAYGVDLSDMLDDLKADLANEDSETGQLPDEPSALEDALASFCESHQDLSE